MVTCSALRRSPTATCCARAAPGVRFCELDAPDELISDAARASHRATTCRRPCCPASSPPSSRSQPDEPGVRVSVAETPEQIVANALARLGLTTKAASLDERRHRPAWPSAASHHRRRQGPAADGGHRSASSSVVALIAAAKFHPFLALMLGTAVMGGVAGVAPADVVTSFTTGFGTTFGSVGILVALGGMLGKLLADSGGADRIVDTILGQVGDNGLPWAMALIAAIIGLPMFFEIGVVLLVPVVILVARRTAQPVDARGDPGPGRPVDPARPGATPPRAGRGHRRPARRPRRHVALRRDRRRTDARPLRPAARPRHHAVGAGGRPDAGPGAGAASGRPASRRAPRRRRTAEATTPTARGPASAPRCWRSCCRWS